MWYIMYFQLKSTVIKLYYLSKYVIKYTIFTTLYRFYAKIYTHCIPASNERIYTLNQLINMA